MFSFSIESVELFLVVFGTLTAIQVGTALYLLSTLRRGSRERKELNRQTFGLLRKVEGLLSRKQEKLVKEYDKMLEQLTVRLPSIIAEEAGQEIYETERKILTRLAELEPDLNGNKEAMQRMNELIKSMERLEIAMIRATSRAVEDVLIENRKALFSSETQEQDVMAA